MSKNFQFFVIFALKTLITTKIDVLYFIKQNPYFSDNQKLLLFWQIIILNKIHPLNTD